MVQVEVEGLRIAYEKMGRGPELVLTQGFVGNGLSTWGRQAEALADDCTVIVWDVPGAGRASDPPESFRVADYADCLAAFLRLVGVERAHLGGVSFGRDPRAVGISAPPASRAVAGDGRWVRRMDGIAAGGEVHREGAEVQPRRVQVMALASAEADLREVLPRVDVPTLLLHGEQDAGSSSGPWTTFAYEASSVSCSAAVCQALAYRTPVEWFGQ
ncbi:alpha/beta fold hydrolase [Mumia zhuanghuii]|uniref:Alpha/beta fold hydrolase n=1 Tax=Mumia zhuanghuii TaxID=2585211 RepID=A0A5C4MZR0_9ACTN|nr:alpha/beta fold hydrolase [Mumia zhuanghuii]TNC35488.1 alpha/beta fold hydrolase [Mumia zhuanghuii]TNC50925.1 alpha/beta fold hydrolase [Mumia zhuanghuii]